MGDFEAELTVSRMCHWERRSEKRGKDRNCSQPNWRYFVSTSLQTGDVSPKFCISPCGNNKLELSLAN